MNYKRLGLLLVVIVVWSFSSNYLWENHEKHYFCGVSKELSNGWYADMCEDTEKSYAVFSVFAPVFIFYFGVQIIKILLGILLFCGKALFEWLEV